MVFCLGQGPYPGLQFFFDYGKPTAHLAKVWAPCGAIWHTSSKGMPRHAHRRWALIRFSDVDKYQPHSQFTSISNNLPQGETSEQDSDH